MGGRGRTSGLITSQISIKQYADFLEITQIKEKGMQVREGGKVESNGDVSPIIFKRCYCCGKHTIMIGTTYETCHICGWIDDDYQNTHPDSLYGMNEICLNEAKELYKKHIK